MASLVAIDIETTGLDHRSDEIIEIGAVLFNENRKEAEWESLVKPRKKIPALISQLTGITDEMVSSADPITAVIQEFENFIGDSTILGHNVRFDISFLQKHNVLKHNQVVDTYELASILFPTASRYNLAALAQQFGCPVVKPMHRALNDANTTRGIFPTLLEKARSIPPQLIAEFLRLSEGFDWDASWLLQSVWEENKNNDPSILSTRLNLEGFFRPPSRPAGQPLKPVIPPIPLNPDEVGAVLQPGGPFDKLFPNFEHRPQQVEMVSSVARSLTESQHLMVEAGTGIGKSFAYLVPAVLWATKNQQRVVVSTNTINLQDQLISKDIPDLVKGLSLDLKASVLKGRSNYLCPRRLEVLRQRGPENIEEMRLLGKVMVWLSESGSGDRTEININGPTERAAWQNLSADEEACNTENCVNRMGGICPFHIAHQAAQTAHIIVVNHALLLADFATGNRIIPDYDYLIIDEAHHLESATTNALSVRISLNEFSRLIHELGGTSSGILGHLLRIFKTILSPSDYAAFHQSAQVTTDYAFRFENHLKTMFSVFLDFLDFLRDGQPVSPYGQQIRITPAIRTLPNWENIEVSWDESRDSLDLLLQQVSQFINLINGSDDLRDPEIDDMLGHFNSVYHRISEIGEHLSALISSPDHQQIYWADLSPINHYLSLQIAPLHIGPLVEQYLWHQKSSVILTSATLTTDTRFDYLRERLSADEADELMLGSPFDYKNSVLLFVANDIPEPSDSSNYQRQVNQTIVHLGKATGGRLLALFTSYAQLKRTSQAISSQLANAEIMVYEQGGGASPNALLETFRSAEKAVLLGTRAFWEGVDIPGEALSSLVITKLPFDVPSDPIIAARSETYEDPFNEYNIPEAILRFRQGFGRLIRTQSDRGVVAILDRRVISKQYGKLFMQSLPDCTLKVGSMHDLPGEAARWLKNET